MIVYVITHASCDGNCSPEVYCKKEIAEARLKELYDRCIEIPEYVNSERWYEHGFAVTYNDDTYDVFDLYSEEVIK